MSSFELYLIFLLDSIGALMILGVILSGVTLGFIAVGYALLFFANNLDKDNDEERLSKLGNWARRLIMLFLLFLLVATFLPTTKQVFTIKAYHVLKDKDILATTDKFFDSVDKYLDEYLKDK